MSCYLIRFQQINQLKHLKNDVDVVYAFQVMKEIKLHFGKE
ncbi:hypothetical protein HMPREF9370_2176 [Neisseria wadsworthii 9715]|uniref:Uncharacterized protein n=1 Tax=Neisseria wadsworthii 9715 TaxID=1030841 RepID=G4CSW6_9NEIS|nr:hypothetical protein HMPREF9370_2176 [Neisseria wadsworthii 9715]